MANSPNPDQLVAVLRETIIALVARDGPDLSARQLGVFLTCYLDPTSYHTVRGLAALLNVNKPAITRALDRLEQLDFARRKPDPSDRRSVLVHRTIKGSAFLRELSRIMREVVKVKASEAATSTEDEHATTAPKTRGKKVGDHPPQRTGH